MKPPRFEYEAPTTVQEAVELLAEHGDEAKVLAGGQSFVPMLNLRLARPSTVVDIRQLPLKEISLSGQHMRLGALVTHRKLENEPAVSLGAQALAQAVPHIGYVSIRNRGTIGGSMAHADATAEIPLCCLALDATVTAQSVRGERTISAEDFFLGPFTTALEPDELLTQVQIPRMAGGERQGFAELARRTGDFALAASAVAISPNDQNIRISVVGPGPTPQLVQVPGPVDSDDQENLDHIAAQAIEQLGELNDSLTQFQARSARAVIIDALRNAKGGEE